VQRNVNPPGGTTSADPTATLRSEWARLPVLPVLRMADGVAAVRAAVLLAGAGIRVVELTATTAGWDEAIAAVRRETPHVVVGLGTVRDTATAERALMLGAGFLVTPYVVPEIREPAAAAGVPVIHGGWTPSEVATAARTGIAKLFPAQVGGPAHLRGLKAVLPEVDLVPTGGIDLDEVPAWLDAGALAVGVGSSLVRDLERSPGKVVELLSELAEPA
jgi:2-dehydro-3-deoxyphosphogluconate aldolase/(4S)-4-hydroxy-2-oxoglutarate aldolase